MIKTLTSEDGKLHFEFNTTRWSVVETYDTLTDVQKFSDSKVDFIGLLDDDYLPKVNAQKLLIYKGLMMKRLKASLTNLCTDVFIIDSKSFSSLPALYIRYSK